ncbi:MAG: orotidine-5'-phosphate decarboxylase [Solirubrobacteraceae bacterium]
MSFAEVLAARVAGRESQIVLGLDPAAGNLWPQADADVATHCAALIAAAGPACVAVKPQLACFERLGAAGWDALERTIAAAHDAGLLVIADGKRGDVPVTAAAYADALYRLGADAWTANPLLGRDSLAPLLDGGAGVFVLVRTSNPGAADIQDLELASGGPLWEELARIVGSLGEVGSSGFSHVGAVVGATQPGHLARARELMPATIFLLPGVGAQGGKVEDLAPAFASGRAGGLVSASRSIAMAHVERGGTPTGAARIEAERLRELAWGLG